MIAGFKDAIGTAGVVFIVMALGSWVALPFVHPVYAALVGPIVIAAAAFAVMRHGEPRHPSLGSVHRAETQRGDDEHRAR